MRTKVRGVNKVRKRLANGSVRTYHYHRATGIRLPAPHTPDFIQAYAEAQNKLAYAEAQNKLKTCDGHDLKQLIAEYVSSAEFASLRPSTQVEYRRSIRDIEIEYGTLPIEALEGKGVRGEFLAWRDMLASTRSPKVADDRLVILGIVLAFAADRGRIGTNPLVRYRRVYKSNRVDRIWADADVSRFCEHASRDMQDALFLALYSGQRQGDLLNLLWSQCRDGSLFIRQSKTGQAVEVPCIAPLRQLLDDMKSRGRSSTHVLTTRSGQPWKKRHFGRQWAQACTRAGIVDLHFHDLRGTAITALADAGCSPNQIAAISGHSLRTVASILEKYASRTRTQAHSAMALLENHLATKSANRLQTEADSEAKAAGEGP